MPEIASFAAVTAGEAKPENIPKGHVIHANKDGVGLAQTDGVAPTDDSVKPYKTALPNVPVTVERRPFVPQEDEKLVDAGTARVNIAATKEEPNGTHENNWAERHENQTVVQQHTAYWDADGDGIIWPLDTYRGCRRWGWNPILSLIAMALINLNLSYPTSPSILPDPFFRIHIARMHKNKHGSDSMTFDNEGRFRPQNFEDLFAKYDDGNKGGLDMWDLLRAWRGQMFVWDFFGWSAAFFEWLATYLLIWPEDGVLRKEDVRRIFDGSIFEWKAHEYERKKTAKGSKSAKGKMNGKNGQKNR
ncbi:Caleosin-domain-containing protein [Aulographum hederae CBS 113979]|uniref:Caleosin-domain-containing protein n=1 Tax=Aulographum hederae CBS 113979 TaxID=1176131 RepID=A0A6G1GP14_9PEZI|nr:Caleosin-domain-containing protein [Aulographum hederae CBS 113979]